MKKLLRFSLLALIALCGGGNLYAEDIIWQEDFSSYSANDVPSGGTYSYACTGTTKVYDEKLAGGTAPELLVAKSNQTFSAIIPLGGKSGEITLTYKANYDRITVSSTTTGVTLGDKSGSGTYKYTITVPSGTESLALEFKNTTSSNVRLDDIKLYQGVAKQPAGLSWGKSSASVTFGNGDDTYKYLPVLQNPNSLSITCSSSEESVATVTNAGEITIVGAGETILSAVFEGNDDYEAQTVTCTVKVNPAPSDTPNTIAEFKALAANTVGVLKITDGVVLAAGNKYIVVKDATGVIMINETRSEGAISVTQGQKISGTINGTKTAFGGLDGIKSITASDITVSDGTITATQIAVSNIEGQEYLTELWQLQDVIVKKDGNNYYIYNYTGAAKVLQIYDEFKIEGAVAAEGTYTLEGLRGKYNATEQFWPTKVTLTSGIQNQIIDTDVNAPLYNLKGERVDGSYRGVVIQNGQKKIQK